MGRPRDEFSWEQVEVSKDGWKCKYCMGDFKGSASRIRNHLSGQGNDISACAMVPEQIRNEALKKITRKRRRSLQNSLALTTTSLEDPSPSSSNDPVSFTQMGNKDVDSTRSKLEATSSNHHILLTKGAIETYVTDALVKFFMCKQLSVDFDFVKDPNFRAFLERAHQYGVPSSLLRGDSLIIEKSLGNIKEEVHQYMLMVKESWKTTGCTLMGFNLSKDNYVLGFYCPKGFIFVEAPNLLSEIGDTLKQHSPSLDIDDVTHVLYHSECSEGFPLCKLSDQSSITWTTTVAHEFCSSISLFPCLRHEIQAMCIELCERSEWTRSLIKKAEKMHQCMNDDSSLCYWYLKIVKQKGFKGFEGIGKPLDNPLSRFLSIMLLEDDLKTRLLYHLRFENFITDRAKIDSVLDDSEFWGDGRELKGVLIDILKISDFMDTLVPTACYVDMVIDKVKHIVFNEDQRSMQEESFWQDLYSTLSRIIVSKQAAAYLNPFYFLQGSVEEKLKITEKVKLTLRNLVREEEQEAIDEQLQRYNDEFNNMFDDIDHELENFHPVKWWEQYGHDLPLLRKYAVKMLSQPVTCMCNQVKKCMFQLEGADDYILRLNVRMMEEFRNLGANIYKPLDLKAL